ncbi:MAG: hypothetical protein M1825_001109 [Sarcosagium campestre]|nr:MAG: hypothetical protein M1825_001109 [Sarcosagium campestre]
MVDTKDDFVHATSPHQKPDSDNESSTTDDHQSQVLSEDATARSSLIEQASSFLEHDEIKHASRDHKTSFLESKGLRKDEIRKLLETDRAEANDSLTATTTPSSSNQEAASPAPRPIITYPEFLTAQRANAKSAPPLLTASSLLTTLYVLVGSALTVQLASTHLLGPMLVAQTEARHSLFSSAQASLDRLTSELESRVSRIPPPARGIKPYRSRRSSSASSSYSPTTSGSDSDPTELFHVDVGTQTFSPPGSPATPSITVPETTTGSELLELQADRLNLLSKQITELISLDAGAGDQTTRAKVGVEQLQTYLDSLASSRSVLSMAAGHRVEAYQQTASNVYGMGRHAGDDEVQNIKAEIRSFKGVLLSAKSFPVARVGSR